MNVFSFLAIPFFIFAGELMLYGGIADKIVDFAKSLVGHMRGGLGMSNVVACTLFGGVSGSPVADVSAMGAVMIPMMKREGYDADYAVNVTTHASLVGALMPTSHNMIIYSLAAGGKVSIGALILAGVMPALVLTICNLVAAYLVAVQARLPGRHVPGLGHRRAHRSRRRCRGCSSSCIILGGILSGVFTATESAAVAVLYALFLCRRRLPHAEVGELPQGGGEGGQDDRRGAAADRHLGDVRLPDQPVQVADLTGKALSSMTTSTRG